MATANNSDKRFYQLTLAIQKAINSIETPVKEKHVRSTIIGTFQEQSAITYWMVAIRLPLQDNRIVAWKFCHVTHKLLREGHPACLDDSQRHISMIENLGKLWVHLREGYGKLVHLYTNLLVCKLKFHARNPRFPGNLQLTADELDAIAENDVNNYFQLCVELFDYMDDILNLQASVFDSLGNARANSMTASGQCRLAALIPCAQDSSQIYDCNVRLLFRLHAALPADTLAGHRERFRQQFKKLSSFYKHASSLQYYRNLLTLPVLPSNPPNFLLQSEFGTYVAPVVSVPEPPPDELDAALIDTSDTVSQNQMPTEPVYYPETESVQTAPTPDHLDAFETRASPSPQPDPVLERDRLIDHLQNELRRMRSEASGMVQERNTMLGSMREHCARLEHQLHAAKNELEEEKQKAETLIAQTPEIKQKLAETEEKAKVTDEKFQKLKGAYTQLREEHIALIRQKAEVDKLSASLRAAAAQHESAKTALQQQLNDRLKDEELLQQSASSSEEIEAYKNEIANLRSELEQSRQKEVELETIRASMEALEIENKTARVEQEDKLTTLSNELKETTDTLQRLKQEKEECESELSKVKEELVGLREKSSDQYTKVVEEKETALKQVSDLVQQHQQEKEEHAMYVNKLQAELGVLTKKCTDTELHYTNQFQCLEDELIDVNKKYDDLTNKNVDLQETIEKQTTEIDRLLGLVDDLNKFKLESETEKENMQTELNEAIKKVESLENEIKCKTDDVIKLKQLMEAELSTKDENTITLQSKIAESNDEIDGLRLKLNDSLILVDNQKNELETYQKEKDLEITILNDKLKNTIECKDEIINNLKSMVAEKDGQVISLNVEVTKLTENVSRLQEELNETQAELEIGRNEFITLKEEHDAIVNRNEQNLILKNQEMRELHNENAKLKEEIRLEKEKLIDEFNAQKQVLDSVVKEKEEIIENIRNEYNTAINEKDTLTNSLSHTLETLKSEYSQFKQDKETEIENLNVKIQEQENRFNVQICEKDDNLSQAKNEIETLKMEISEMQDRRDVREKEMDDIILQKEKERQMLEARFESSEGKRLNAECELQDMLQHNTILEADVAALRRQLEEAKVQLEKQSSKIVGCASEAALQVTQGALEALEGGAALQAGHAARRAADALSDLAKHAQVKGNEESLARSAIFAAHNTAQLSAYITDVADLSTDLELSDKLHKECKTMLSATEQCLSALKGGTIEASSCADARSRVLTASEGARAAGGGGALSVDEELAGMDRAVELAAQQIEEMLKASRAGDTGVKLEVNGKILDACTALMGAVKALVRDSRALQAELGDPATREHVYRRSPQWSEGLVSAAKAVVFAAKLLVAVDVEGDTGVKLEVNGKILDACTALMGAVKALVRDSRALQAELGDPATREHVYRRSPQWSEGLVSAAKAVVFAAKLLVSSADEAVGAAGRVEGVGAAAQEVAGSTAQLVAASRARAAPASASLARLTQASRSVAAATGAVVAAVRAAAAHQHDTEALDTTALTLTATRRLEMESKVRSLELETALEAERARLAALRKRHYHLAQQEENGNMTNGKE